MGSFACRERNLAAGRRYRPSPSLEQARKAILRMPSSTDVELRNRALIACLLLTGARVAALTSFKLRHVMPNRIGIEQDALDVRTKGSKTFSTYFFPVGDDIREIFVDYVDHLRGRLGWDEDDPLFPATRQDVGATRKFEIVGLDRGKGWKTADPVRDIFRRAFDAVELPRYAPHSIRRTLALLGQERCRTPMEYKAWSQNLGHNAVLTTFTSYGALSDLDQAEIIAGLAPSKGNPGPEVERLLKLLGEQLNRDKGGGGDGE